MVGVDMSELFWNSSIEEMKKGYIYDELERKYICLVCGKFFEQGLIYPFGDVFCDAERAMKVHIEKEHGSILDYLLGMNKKYTGISEVQHEVISYLKEGKSDKEISNLMGITSSTIRNHRFKLREKEKQAKVFLSIMELLNSDEKENRLIDIHKGATMVDERYVVTKEEKGKIIDNYFTGEDKMQLTNFPAKEKRKIVVLKYIAENFKDNKKYTEKEVNIILKRIYDDYATLRRYLIEYGFMERSKDCKEYWIKL